MQEIDRNAAYVDSEAPVIGSAPAEAERRAAIERSPDRVFVSHARFVKRERVFSSPRSAVAAREGPVAAPRVSNVRRRCINLERDVPVLDADCIEIVADDGEEQPAGADECPEGANKDRERSDEAWVGRVGKKKGGS
jgi:hypothetical protein